ncbi:MAG: hydratase [Clostridia bacterium]|nr:hydratase [Clostridia bacterium]
MVKLHDGGVYLVNGEISPFAPEGCSPSDARRGTIAYGIISRHNDSGEGEKLKLRFDSLTSHDITYVGIIQTSRASGMTRFPLPYVMTNCHNSLCAVGGTINEDDHMFALSAAKKYGGIYVPTDMAVIHTYNREMMAGCGRMILGSDSHTRYGALGTMGIGEGGGELAKQLVGRTYDLNMPQVVAVYLSGEPAPGVGPHDVSLAIIKAVYDAGYVKNKVMEFVGPGVGKLPVEYRNGIDVMTTETTCLSSIWQTDSLVEEYYNALGRPDDYRELRPADVAYYDGCVYVNLSKIEPMIALPVHPKNAFAISELKRNAADILSQAEKDANRAFENSPVRLDLMSKLRGKDIFVDQGIVAGCAGGTYDNIVAVSDILAGNSCGNGRFRMSVYPGSMPVYAAALKSGALMNIIGAGAIVRECFCGPCFGAGDTPANGELSIRHTTRNFPNREGSKPGEGQLAGVALMDARSIAATAINGGKLTSATEIDVNYSAPRFFFDGSLYQKRVLDARENPDARSELVMGPNIKDWPELPSLSKDLLIRVASRITDPVTTTDELIPSGETASLRSNPLRLAEFTLSRKDADYVPSAKAVNEIEKNRRAGKIDEAVARVYESLTSAGVQADPTGTVIASAIYAHKPGDGSAREQAASCQRVLGAGANISREYATKRYRTNLINWGMIPFRTDNDEPFVKGAWVFVPSILDAVKTGKEKIDAWVVTDESAPERVTLILDPLTAPERDILAAGCLINYYRQGG